MSLSEFLAIRKYFESILASLDIEIEGLKKGSKNRRLTKDLTTTHDGFYTVLTSAISKLKILQNSLKTNGEKERSRRGHRSLSSNLKLKNQQEDKVTEETKQLVRFAASGPRYTPIKRPTAMKTNGDGNPLQFACDASDLGENMVLTITRALASLDENRVKQQGYFLLNVASLPPIDWAEFSRDIAKPNKSEILGFSYTNGPNGIAHSRSTKNINFEFPDFSQPGIGKTDLSRDDLEEIFQEMIDKPPEGNLAYYIGAPFGSLPHTELVHAGERLIERGDGNLPGINTPYWYVSGCDRTPANLHIEDAKTGSVNLLLAGAPKDWLFIDQGCVSKLEICLRKEFPSHKPCSQFIRHLDILISPKWLHKREIGFSIIRQYPGQMVCTLVGAYHQVKNCGKNFAVAINFELSQWPNEPTGYTWCTRGAKHCGSYAITEADFRLPLKEHGTSPSRNGSPQLGHSSTDPIALSSDSETEYDNKGNLITSLPLEDPDPSQDILNLIKFCEAKLSPRLLGCVSTAGMTKMLERFLPGTWIDDHLLRILLRIICSGSSYFVAESLGRNARMPGYSCISNLTSGTRGLVFPFYIYENHWALGIFNYSKMEFISYDIDIELAVNWARTLQEGIKVTFGEECDIKVKTGIVPSNPDLASCALVCCLALERYLGLYPSNIKPSTLRGYYFRKLLTAVTHSSYHKNLTGDSSSDLALFKPSSALEESYQGGTESPNIEKALDDSLKSFPNKRISPWLKEALMDLECSLSLEEKARILQMVMQCSSSAYEYILRISQTSMQTDGGVVGEDSQDFHRHVFVLMEEIVKSKDEFYLPVLRQRILYIQLSKAFKKRVSEEEKKIQATRRERNRMLAQGQKLDREENSGKTAKNRVLDGLIENWGTESSTSSSAANPTKRLRIRLNTFIEMGSNLDYLTSKLGVGILFTFPAVSALSCDFKLPFENARTLRSLSKPLEPSAYNILGGNSAEYFIKWFPILKTELSSFTGFDYQLFLPRAQLPWLELPTNREFLETHIRHASLNARVSKRPHKMVAQDNDGKPRRRAKMQG